MTLLNILLHFMFIFLHFQLFLNVEEKLSTLLAAQFVTVVFAFFDAPGCDVAWETGHKVTNWAITLRTELFNEMPC